MRLLHTADWHLGQTLHGVPRSFEHGRFLAWLLDQIERREVDALVIAGDVFDVASPSAEAQARYFGFLADARRRFPHLDIVVVGGNHDAPARIDAARPVLSAIGVHVVGALPRVSSGQLDLDRIFIPLTDKRGASEALLIAVPFLRPKDLFSSRAHARWAVGLGPPPEAIEGSAVDASPHPRPSSSSRESPPSSDQEPASAVRGHAELYEALVEAAEHRRGKGAALVATGHAYVAGGHLSALSERKIQQGNQNALPASIFPRALDYVALGHLHLAQTVGTTPLARYSGSPIPLSMAELGYPHQVVLVDLRGPGEVFVKPTHVPRFRPILRLPPEPAPFEVVAPLLAGLPRLDPSVPEPEDRPLLEVRIRLEAARPRLRKDIEEVLEGALHRLVRIDVERPQGAFHVEPAPQELGHLTPEDVFIAAHRRQRAHEPPAAVLRAFRQLLETVEHRDEP